MKKIIILNLSMAIVFNLMSFTIEFGKEIYEVSFQELRDLNSYEIRTERDKNGVHKSEIWIGASLKDILDKFSIKVFEKLQVVASDNYMVRFDPEEIKAAEPIIAYSVDGKDLENEYIRLIAPHKRDMFWIRDIARFIIEEKSELYDPEMIFIAENILNRMPLQTDPEPFTDVTGYFCRELLDEVFPTLDGEYLLVAKDGVRHTLEFNNYLSKAALINGDGKYSFQSPQMPAGMWIKDLAYIQKDEIGIIFIDQFTNWHDMKKLLNWIKFPDIFVGYSQGKPLLIDLNLPMNPELIKELEKFEWQ